jgi:hypothetical protein
MAAGTTLTLLGTCADKQLRLLIGHDPKTGQVHRIVVVNPTPHAVRYWVQSPQSGGLTAVTVPAQSTQTRVLAVGDRPLREGAHGTVPYRSAPIGLAYPWTD